jgi:hypothetical protein
MGADHEEGAWQESRQNARERSPLLDNFGRRLAAIRRQWRQCQLAWNSLCVAAISLD